MPCGDFEEVGVSGGDGVWEVVSCLGTTFGFSGLFRVLGEGVVWIPFSLQAPDGASDPGSPPAGLDHDSPRGSWSAFAWRHVSGTLSEILIKP